MVKVELQYHLLSCFKIKVKDDTEAQPLPFGLDLCPMTMTYITSLTRVKVDPHNKKQSQSSNDSIRRDTQKDRKMEGRMNLIKCMISLPCLLPYQ